MHFIVYSKPNCPQCDRAKALLKNKGLTYEERFIDVGQPKEEGKTYITAQELKELIPTAKTAPQIMLDEKVVGGLFDLQKLIGA